MEKYMHKIKEKLCELAEEIGQKGDLSSGDVERLYKLTDTIKNIGKIDMMEGGGYSREGGYSQNGDWEAEMRGRYDRDASYRGRKRDSMGRYSRDGEGGQGGSYSRHGNDIRERIQEMMEDAGSEKEREVLRRCVEML